MSYSSSAHYPYPPSVQHTALATPAGRGSSSTGAHHPNPAHSQRANYHSPPSFTVSGSPSLHSSPGSYHSSPPGSSRSSSSSRRLSPPELSPAYSPSASLEPASGRVRSTRNPSSLSRHYAPSLHSHYGEFIPYIPFNNPKARMDPTPNFSKDIILTPPSSSTSAEILATPLNDLLNGEGRQMQDPEGCPFEQMGFTLPTINFVITWPGYPGLSFGHALPTTVEGMPTSRRGLAYFIATLYKEFINRIETGNIKLERETDPKWRVGRGGGITVDDLGLVCLRKTSESENIWQATLRVMRPRQ